MLEEMKVVIADIDMTLTAKGGELPEITKEAFEILHRNDVRIGLGTGREILKVVWRWNRFAVSSVLVTTFIRKAASRYWTYLRMVSFLTPDSFNIFIRSTITRKSGTYLCPIEPI